MPQEHCIVYGEMHFVFKFMGSVGQVLSSLLSFDVGMNSKKHVELSHDSHKYGLLL